MLKEIVLIQISWSFREKIAPVTSIMVFSFSLSPFYIDLQEYLERRTPVNYMQEVTSHICAFSSVQLP